MVPNSYVKIDSGHVGDIAGYSGWSRTDYVDISAYEHLTANISAQYTVFYDETKENRQAVNVTANTQFSVPDFAKYIIISAKTSPMSTLTLSGYSSGGEVTQIKDKLDNFEIEVDDTLSITGEPADAKKVGDVVGIKELNLDNYTAITGAIDADGNFVGNSLSREYPAAGISKLIVTGPVSRSAYICFLTESAETLVAGDTPPYVEGMSKPYKITANSIVTLEVPNDAVYIEMAQKFNSNSGYMPSAVSLILNSGLAHQVDVLETDNSTIRNDLKFNKSINENIIDVLSNGASLIKKDLFVRGSIGAGGTGDAIGTTGKNYIASSTRIVTKPVVSLQNAESITLTPTEGYKYYLFVFDNELTNTVIASGWTELPGTYPINVDNAMCAIMIAKKGVNPGDDDQSISVDDYDKVEITGVKDIHNRFDLIESALEKVGDPLPIEKTEYVDSFMARFNTTGDISSYLFFTDPHIYSKNVTDDSIIALFTTLRKAYYSTQTNFILCGGDWLQGGDNDIIPGGPTPEQACAQLGFIDGAMRKMFRNYRPIFGNHDSNYKNTRLNGKTITNIMFSEEGSRYYSFTDRNTRYYVFDTELDTGYTQITNYRQEQLNWFAGELITNKEEHIVLCFHICITRSSTSSPWYEHVLLTEAISCAKAYNNKETFTSSWASNSYDFSGTTGKIHYIIGGHTHRDFILNKYGFPVIISTRSLIDFNAPTFDLILNDYATNTVYCERVGSGANRIIHCDLVTVDGSETLSTEYAGTVTWETSDEAIVTVADGVVTAVSTGNALITAIDENGKQEAWIVAVA